MYINDTPYPSVSDVLKPYLNTSYFTPESALRGELVHAALASYLLGVYSPPVQEEYRGYVESGKRWIDEMVVEVILVEERLIDPRLKYCGKPDLIARLKANDNCSMIDFKTGQQELKSFPIQNAAYRMLAKANNYFTHNGLTIRLKPDGSGVLITEYPANCQKEWNVFVGLLNGYNYFLK